MFSLCVDIFKVRKWNVCTWHGPSQLEQGKASAPCSVCMHVHSYVFVHKYPEEVRFSKMLVINDLLLVGLK